MSKKYSSFKSVNHTVVAAPCIFSTIPLDEYNVTTYFWYENKVRELFP
ncbi:26748_t:CDS:2 [Dentiscutata erythropus]|uniref:26748_t:CDS:1 n=1 Tax=Dentiscutata erythropus TaxID=1348616 RepID=A0A9N8ZMQ5_9GLOM|nr:26748_t:CDS:2 [Dentiscutata erythropus]